MQVERSLSDGDLALIEIWQGVNRPQSRVSEMPVLGSLKLEHIGKQKWDELFMTFGHNDG